MSCQGCSSGSSCGGQAPQDQAPQEAPSLAQSHNHIKHVLVVMSGKGGVGKSSFSSLLARSLQKAGKTVGLLDADVTGPSLPKLFDAHGPMPVGAYGAEPLTTKGGIKLVSMNLLLEKDDDPVVWRGPILGNVVKEFYENVYWGDLDVLVVDLPPGTGDVPLTVLQSMDVDGAVIVTSPQSLSNMVVRKGIKMLELMEIPIWGLAENMSYLACPSCGDRIEIFGPSHAQESAQTHGLDFLGQFPLDPALAQAEDQGGIESYEGPVLETMNQAVAKHLLPKLT